MNSDSVSTFLTGTGHALSDHTTNGFANRLSSQSTAFVERGTPESELQGEEIAQIRAKVLQMDILNSDGVSSREKELATMVLRLAELSSPRSTQATSQASAIEELSLQRDYLVQKAEEERMRWESERTGWARASEALVAQRNETGRSSNQHQDLERYCSILQADNADLRVKEIRLHKRLSSLETEILKLKPVLLLQPFPSTSSRSSLAHASTYLSSLPYPAASGREAASAQRAKVSRKRKLGTTETELKLAVKAVEHTANFSGGIASSPSLDHRGDNGDIPLQTVMSLSLAQEDSSPFKVPTVQAESSGTLLLMSTDITPPSPSPIGISPVRTRSSSRKEHVDSTAISPPSPSSLPKPLIPSTSDARTEHLLLAARVIGRKRAAIASGIVDAEQERRKERRAEKEKSKSRKERKMEFLERPPSPGKGKTKTVTKNSSAGHTKVVKKGSTATVRGGMGEDGSVSRSAPQRAGSQHPYSRAGPKPRSLLPTSTSSSSTQLNGMDSLLSAARSMMDSSPIDGDHDSRTSDDRQKLSSRGVGTRNTVSTSGPEDVGMAPPTKRRKINRERSALDVLADQAAAAVSTPKVRLPGGGGGRGWEDDEDAEGDYDEEIFISHSTDGVRRSGRLSTPSLKMLSLVESRRATPRLISAPDSGPKASG
ncbi:hypothetical protein BDP27DRAFT_1313255 [Rhodocollybia butyracea]|uniref:Uncharacterized protein n=1 Tax=Rhodocollybia butyracea TaxID=206335 RepID=A0A9P5Q9U4_9AGAR|nr:hypothetical protein BDP27DRAFT_1313255 [Rhodocollybia butyracea]